MRKLEKLLRKRRKLLEHCGDLKENLLLFDSPADAEKAEAWCLALSCAEKKLSKVCAELRILLTPGGSALQDITSELEASING